MVTISWIQLQYFFHKKWIIDFQDNEYLLLKLQKKRKPVCEAM